MAAAREASFAWSAAAGRCPETGFEETGLFLSLSVHDSNHGQLNILGGSRATRKLDRGAQVADKRPNRAFGPLGRSPLATSDC